MIRRPRRPVRRGVTLLEALTAIFIVAIGLLALLTLFPVGAMSMAQALKDDRCAQCASQGDALVRTQWRSSVVEPVRTGTLFTEPVFGGLDDPNQLERSLTPPGTNILQHRNKYLPDQVMGGSNPFLLPGGITIPGAGPVSPTSLVEDTNAAAATTVPPSNSYDVFHNATSRRSGPSFPILIDPVGYYGRLALNPDRYWVGRTSVNPQFPNPYPGLLLPRRSMLGITDSSAALAVFALTDDLTFNQNGSPGTLLRRQGRYTWAALVQRPRNDDIATAVLKILVFDGRSTLPPDGDEVMAASVAPVSEGTRLITVDVPPRSAEQPPVVRKGGWVLDATMQNGATGLHDPLSIRNAHFYRIVGVTEVSSGPTGTRYDLDIDPPLRRPTVSPDANLPAGFTYTAQFYFLAGLSEVFERPSLRPDAEASPTN